MTYILIFCAILVAFAGYASTRNTAMPFPFVTDTDGIERACRADDWLMFCANEHGSMSFDTWWSLAKFSTSVQERYAKANPGKPVPTKDQIGEVLDAMRRRPEEVLYIDSSGRQLKRLVP